MAICLATYSGVGSIVGKIFGIYSLLESTKKSVYLLVLVLGVCTASLVGLFISRDFSIAYVAGHSNLAMDHIYTWVAFYAGNEGSLLYIAFVLSVMAALAVRFAPSSVRPTLPFSTAIMMVVLVFFLVVMALMANPFAKLGPSRKRCFYALVGINRIYSFYNGSETARYVPNVEHSNH